METTSDAQSSADGSGWPRALGAAYGMGLLGALLGLVFGLVGGLLGSALGLSITLRLVVALVLAQYVAFIGPSLAYLRWRGLDADAIRTYLGVRLPGLREVGVAVGGYVGLLVLVLGIGWLVQLLGVETAQNQSAEIAKELPRLIPVFVVASVLVIGPSEETLFRGVVQNRLREALSAPLAIGLTALLFASIHFMALTGGAGARVTTVAVLLVPSLVFGVVYEYTGNLVVPAAIHGVWNATVFLAIWASLQTGTASVLPF